jgi:NAD(P)-dependent dehydrogenase (short-subunit alcohol dehydrogenase family)
LALVEKTVGAFGALHIAFNNAGTEGQYGLLTTEQTVEHYHHVSDINSRGVSLSIARNPGGRLPWLVPEFHALAA